MTATRQYVDEERVAPPAAGTDVTAPDALERVLAAFVDPVLALRDDPDDVCFARLVLRGAADPSSPGAQRDRRAVRPGGAAAGVFGRTAALKNRTNGYEPT